MTGKIYVRLFTPFLHILFQIQSYVIDLCNMFVNTMNWSGGESADSSWKELNIARQLQTQAEPASRLLRDMLVVVLNRIQQVFSFVSLYYHTHRLRAPCARNTTNADC